MNNLDEGLLARHEGCSASLIDKGNNHPIVPACMGAIGIAGAESSIVGCNNIDNCRELMTLIPGKVSKLSYDEAGVVSRQTTVRRGRPLRESLSDEN